MTDLRARLIEAYEDIDCPHNDRIPQPYDTYVVVPCGPCVADAVIGVIAAPSEGQRERVDAIEARLIATEVARIEAVKAGDRDRHNDLANMNRLDIGQVAVNDLRSLVTRWMLRLGKAAAEEQETG